MTLSNPYVAITVFSLVGIVLVGIQLFLFSLTVPYKIIAEIEEENPAIGWVIAGLLISSGLIVNSAMRHNDSLVNTILFSLAGSVLNILGYHIVEWATPHWSLNEAIDKHHKVSGAVICFGVFVTVGLIVAGAIS
ncbi:MAG: DUF350 domain-containing protein [Actinobacteria bacterium]|nr:DUF350 domain-containing protein [Actinomycetota bacterium]